MGALKNKPYVFTLEFLPNNAVKVLRYTRTDQARIYRDRTPGAVLVTIPDELTDLSHEQLAQLYNLANPDKPTKRFSDKEKASEKVFPLLRDISATGVKAKPATPGERGRPSRYKNMRIVRKVAANPRKPGTHGFKAWELITDGMTFEEYMAAAKDVGGGGLKHLRWCHNRNFVGFE